MSKSLIYKVACVALLGYTLVAGLAGPVPRKVILEESIRNLYYHVPLWFVMLALLLLGAVHSIRYLYKGSLETDIYAEQATVVGLVAGLLGLTTGMVWARYTWGDWWSGDPKQTGTAIGLLLYGGYFTVRSAFADPERRGRVGAVVNVICFAALIPLIYVLPNMGDSLHPGNGGNPTFKKYDYDYQQLMVFYPAIIGWLLLGYWITELAVRSKKLFVRTF